MRSFASKSACGLIAALFMIGVSTAQVGPPGGGGTGGGNGGSTGGGGGGGSVISNSQWRITTTSQCYSATAWLTPQGSGSNTQATPNLGRSTATVDGVLGSISAKCGGTYTHTIKWIGVGAPPPYAYAVLTSVGGYSDYDGGSGVIDLGLPMVAGGDASHQFGRKIVKLKLGPNGEAEFTVTGSTTATANSSYELGLYSANDGVFSSGIGLDLKALGLDYESYKRVRVIAGDHEQIYAKPAWGDDMEHQFGEIGVAGGASAVDLGVNRQGLFEFLAVGFNATMQGPGDVSYFFQGAPNVVTKLHCTLFYSNNELVQMRKTPKTVKVTATQQESGAQIPGPFKGDIELSVWAKERILATFERHVTLGAPSSLFGLPYEEIPADTAFSKAFLHGETWLIGGKVGLTRGNSFDLNLIPELVKLGVKADTNAELNGSWSETNSETKTWIFQPKPYLTWLFAYEVEERFHVDRSLASYGQHGYESDFDDRVTDVAQPFGHLHFERVVPF
jgi:hypothetical protein